MVEPRTPGHASAPGAEAVQTWGVISSCTTYLRPRANGAARRGNPLEGICWLKGRGLFGPRFRFHGTVVTSHDGVTIFMNRSKSANHAFFKSSDQLGSKSGNFANSAARKSLGSFLCS